MLTGSTKTDSCRGVVPRVTVEFSATVLLQEGINSVKTIELFIFVGLIILERRKGNM